MALESSVEFSTSAGSQEVGTGGSTQQRKALCSVKGLFQNQGLEMAKVTQQRSDLWPHLALRMAKRQIQPCAKEEEGVVNT